MYKIVFYKDERGNCQVLDEINNLRKKNDKDSRINLNKIEDIINGLKKYGMNLGMPRIRRLRNDIWEMRPIRNRILFFSYKNEKIVLLHSFVKKTNKTPNREIEKAIKEMNNYIRGEENEE